jgi:hypothetical protein
MKRARTDNSNKLPVLISYAFLRVMGEQRVSAILNNPEFEILLDCGAFTAMNAGHEIRLDDYIEFLLKWKHRLFGYLALDKLQDPKTTAGNLRVMVDAGLAPIPVHVFGDDQKKMDELFEMSQWVALGGLRRPHRGAASPEYIKQKMQWARGRRVHWLGYVRDPMLRAFRPYSCDCSSFSGGMRYGNVDVYAGRGRWHKFTYRRAISSPLSLTADVRRLVRDYGFSMQDFTDERHWRNGNREHGMTSRECLVAVLPARSWVRYVMEFKRVFGTRIFMAAVPAHVTLLKEAYGFALQKGWIYDGQNIRDDRVRGAASLAGRSRGGRILEVGAQASVSCPGGERGVA